jgi:hypothetical protein
MKRLIKAFLVILMFLIIVNISYAQGLIVLISPTNNFVQSNTSIRFYYNITNNNPIANCSLILNNNIEQSSSSITPNTSLYFDKTLAEGNYNWSVDCSETNNTVFKSNIYSLTVDITKPSVSLNYPSNNLETNINNITFKYTPTDVNLKNCSLFSDFFGIWQNTKTDNNQNNGVMNNFSIMNLPDGKFIWNIKCYDSGNLFSYANSNYTLLVDTTAPSILSSSPNQGVTVTSPSTTLSITTNENANCRYSTSNNVNYSDMIEFSSTDGLMHTKTITGLTDNTYHYYVICKDSLGNTMTSSYELSFEVSLAPTAEISLSDPSPIKAGTIKVTLLTSKNMRDTPTLTYSFDNSPSKTPVSLTGADSLWSGYIVIHDNNEKKIGTFHFSGTDTNGITGNFITNGKLFIVDTIEPLAPLYIKAEAEKNGDIKLKWYSEDDNVDYYNIYRATSTGVSNLDYYTKTNDTQFIDSSTIDKVTYYYKVAVVDKAGNIGPLSTEVYGTSVSLGNTTKEVNTISTANEADIPKVLPPNLVPKVDDSIKKIDNLLLDVMEAKSNLEDSEDEAKKELINELGLIKDIDGIESRLNNMKAELVNLKSSYKAENELEQELNKIKLDIKKIKKTTPKEITLIEKTEFIQSIDQEDIRKAIDELFNGLDLSEEDKNNYISRNKKNQDKIKVETKIRIITLEYLDGTRTDKTLIQKKLSHENPNPLDDVIVIEIIPKEVVDNINNVEFITKDYEVLKEDPILKWGFFKLNYEGEYIKYIVNKRTNIEDAKKAKSIVLLNLNQIEPKTPVTGYSIFSFSNIGLTKTQTIFIWVGIITIIGLITYYFIFVKGNEEILYRVTNYIKEKKMRNSPKERRLTNSVQHPKQILPSFDMAEIKNLDPHINTYLLLNKLYHRISSTKLELADKLYPLVISIHKALESIGYGKETRSYVKTDESIDIHSLITEAQTYLDNNQYNRAILLYPQIRLMYKNLAPDLKKEAYYRCLDLHNRIKEISGK